MQGFSGQAGVVADSGPWVRWDPTRSRLARDPALGLAVAFDGRLSNSPSLRRRLARTAAHVPPGDAFTVLHAYAMWGPSCVEHFDGAFALLVHDGPGRRLFGAVDRLGHRSLYYGHRPGVIRFASRPDDVPDAPGSPGCRPVHPDALVRYLLYGHVAAPRSVRTGVRRLPRAHRFTWDLCTGRFAQEPWWELPVPDRDDEQRPFDDWVGPVRNAFVEVVEAQLQAPGIIGVLADGHWASAAITRLARQRLGARRVRPYAPPDSTLPDAAGALDAMLAGLDEPLADDGLAAAFVQAAPARGVAAVALSAAGAEELLCDHATFRWLGAARLYNALVPGVVHRRIVRPAAGRRLDRVLRGLKVPEAHRLWRWIGPFDPTTVAALVQPEVLRPREMHGILVQLDWLADATVCRDRHTRDALLYARTCWPGRVLPKLDALSTATGLPLRTPLLDRRFVELAARVPGRLRRAVIRAALQPWLPAYRSAARRKVREPVAPITWPAPDALEEAGLRPEAVSMLVEAHRDGRRDVGSGLRALALLDGWLRLRRTSRTTARMAA